MRNIGVWLDKEKAHVVTLTAQGEDFRTIPSELEFYNLKGRSPGRFKWGGTQNVVHERKYLEREKQQLKAYFKNLANAVEDADALIIFGPADTNAKFRKELDENYKSISARIKGVIKADSMTENQVSAFVRDFFKMND